MTQPEKKYTFWELFQKEIIYLFSFVIFLTFAFNFTKYAWTHTGFELYNHFVWWLFDIKIAWGFKIWAGITTLLLIPISLISFVFLSIRVIKPALFMKNFIVKGWYSIFILQILTWILIISH